MWRLCYHHAHDGGYRLELTTPAGFLYAYGHSRVIPDVELEAWLIHDAGLEGSQVDVQRSCAVGHVSHVPSPHEHPAPVRRVRRWCGQHLLNKEESGDD